MHKVGATFMHMGTSVLSVQGFFMPGLVLNFRTVALPAVVWANRNDGVKGVHMDLSSSNQFSVVSTFFLLPFLSCKTDLLKVFTVNRLQIRPTPLDMLIFLN